MHKQENDKEIIIFGDTRLKLRYWWKLDRLINSDCWEYNGALDSNGYGTIKINYIQKRLHVFMYEKFFGIIPINYVICHTCDNRKCGNPNHLYAGTLVQNNIDKRNRRGGAKLTLYDVDNIRQLLHRGIKISKIALQFNVTTTHIYEIRKGNVWN